MRTGEEMYQYCWDNKFGVGASKKWGVKHFDLIANALEPDEEPLMCMIGLRNYKSASDHEGTFAFAFTNKRIIMAQAKVLGQIVQSISYDYVNDVTMSTTLTDGFIEIDTAKEDFNIEVPKQMAPTINDVIHQVLDTVRKPKETTSTVTFVPSSAADEILKYKNLLDIGAITQEEYDKKKSELLG